MRDRGRPDEQMRLPAAGPFYDSASRRPRLGLRQLPPRWNGRSRQVALQGAQKLVRIQPAGGGDHAASGHIGRSVQSLQGLDIDFLKLDGVCTRNLTTDSVHQEVVSAVTRLSRAVGFKVIAEQVEDQPSFDGLRDLGVNFIQGNYVEAPQALGE